MDARCLARLAVSPHFLVDFCKSGPRRCVDIENGLPPDARYRGVEYDATIDTFYLVIESRTFPPIAVGQPLPELAAPLFHRIDA